MAVDERQEELKWLPLGPAGAGDPAIAESPFPPRPDPSTADLVSSVRLHGVLCPIVVRKTANGTYQIVCGYRRYLAAKEAGLTRIPAIVRDMKDAEAIRCYLSVKLLRRRFPEEEQKAALELLKGFQESAESRRAPSPSETGETAPKRRIVKESAAGTGRRYGASSRTAMSLLGETLEVLSTPLGASDKVGGLLSGMAEILNEARDLRRINADRVEALFAELLAALKSPPGLDYRAIISRASENPLAAHSVLTALVCARVADHLEWTAELSRAFVIAGLLHDVGMVFIRKARIDAPRALSAAERAEVQSHTGIGAALIAGTGAWSQEVSLCARDHHERWNGTGYPSGRKGAEVCFPARLMGLVDTYAALVGPRPHRDVLEPEAALERLSNALELGLFDPSFLFLVRGPLRESLEVPRLGSRTELQAETGKPVEPGEVLITIEGQEESR